MHTKYAFYCKDWVIADKYSSEGFEKHDSRSREDDQPPGHSGQTTRGSV